MQNVSRIFFATTLMALAACEHAAAQIQIGEARFLLFADELRRARGAIGREAECRVIVEDVLARCELRTAGGHAIQIHFSDVPAGMLSRKSLILVRGTVEPQQFSGVLAAYGIPTEIAAPCISAAPIFEAYVGDYQLLCGRGSVTISYARRF